MDVRLTVVAGAKPATVRLKLPTVIGRSTEATLKVPHAQVSRQHCELYEEEDLLVAYDLGSSNGTFVDQVRINEPTFVYPGAMLRVGQVVFRADYAAEASSQTNLSVSAHPTANTSPAAPERHETAPGRTTEGGAAERSGRAAEPETSSPESGGCRDDSASGQLSGEISAVIHYHETSEGSFVGIDDLPSEPEPRPGKSEPQARAASPRQPDQAFVLDTGRPRPRNVDEDDSALRHFLENL